ncbi:MAG: nucleoside triphosphate pyrophosphohydrolase [Planctomycetes bacterium]|nr:nucleoside triphosphate pyrophosphohydrolase [Planctomycetota bacterium]
MSDSKPAPRPLEVPASIGEARADGLRTLLAIVDRLRAPDGCPWDREQTLRSVAPHLIEEVHELVESIELGDDSHTIEEAGDLLMGLVLLAKIAEQSGSFDLARIAQAVNEKLIRRHPHVFGEVHARSADEALANWDAIKRAERAEKQEDTSALAGIPVALPALQRAQRMGAKALSAGFRWNDVRGALLKVREEVDELAREIEVAGLLDARDAKASEEQVARLEHELGDVLMATSFLGNYLKLEPERATRAALRRFEQRFRAMELDLGRPFGECSLEQMMAAWQRAK